MTLSALKVIAREKLAVLSEWADQKYPPVP